MEDNKQVQDVEITGEELAELLASGELSEDVEEVEDGDTIPFDYDAMNSLIEQMGEVKLNVEQFDKGSEDISYYLGQFMTLVGSGINSDTALLFMNWVREDQQIKDSIDMQVEISKIEGMKLRKETI